MPAIIRFFEKCSIILHSLDDKVEITAENLNLLHFFEIFIREIFRST